MRISKTAAFIAGSRTWLFTRCARNFYINKKRQKRKRQKRERDIKSVIKVGGVQIRDNREKRASLDVIIHYNSRYIFFEREINHKSNTREFFSIISGFFANRFARESFFGRCFWFIGRKSARIWFKSATLLCKHAHVPTFTRSFTKYPCSRYTLFANERRERSFLKASFANDRANISRDFTRVLLRSFRNFSFENKSRKFCERRYCILSDITF